MTSQVGVRQRVAAAHDGTDATGSARRAAAAAGVRLRLLEDLTSVQDAAALYAEVWRTSTRAAPVSPDLMRALSHAGGYVAGAYDGTRLVAASLAFHTRRPEAGLHSHISAVLDDMRGRDVGRALKLHQRGWALTQGIRTITWTYDPLLRRNAWFNVTKLRASAVDYLVDFYGSMADAQNGDDPSDRAVALWDLDAPDVAAAAQGRRTEADENVLRRAGAHVALRRGDDGGPAPGLVPTGARCILVQIPDDIQQLRLSDPECAAAWRTAGREVLEPLLAGNWVARGFTRSGCYVLEEIH